MKAIKILAQQFNKLLNRQLNTYSLNVIVTVLATIYIVTVLRCTMMDLGLAQYLTNYY